MQMQDRIGRRGQPRGVIWRGGKMRWGRGVDFHKLRRDEAYLKAGGCFGEKGLKEFDGNGKS